MIFSGDAQSWVMEQQHGAMRLLTALWWFSLLSPRVPSVISQEFKECLSTFPDPNKCKDFAEDYMECLHHKKEVGIIAVLGLP